MPEFHADTHDNSDFRTGAIVTHTVPMRPMSTINRWNLYEIRAIGNKIDVFINGTRMGYFDNAGLGSGYIALQRFDEGIIKFRDIKIKTW